MSDHPTPAARTALDEATGWARLLEAHGPRELHAAILALLLPPGSQRARRAWLGETPGIAAAPALREAAKSLGAAARLPMLELLAERMAGQPLAARQELLEAMRRVMGARGQVRPIDRLHWLYLRRAFGDEPAGAPRTGGSADIALWLQSEVLAIADLSAWLSRLVPDADRGPAWYDSVLNPWRTQAELPPHRLPDAETLVIALEGVRALGWMQRPVLVRHWVARAIDHSGGGTLDESAADALRLMCRLLDCPLPPELARQFRRRPGDADG